MRPLPVILIVLLSAMTLMAAPPTNDWNTVVAVVAADKAEVKEAPAEDPQGTIRLTFRERRKLGLTIRNIRKAVAELKESGDLDRQDVAGTSAQVLEKLVKSNPQAVEDAVGERDWASFLDALLSFIEKLMPIILLFFGG